MKAFKRFVAEMIKIVSRQNAVLACGAASFFGGYQTKEPENIYKK